ncbi:hypothetical protein INT48_005617 [Thamnidium elegans]|uniref:GHMP kinase N-terminal domain-containing protein n=1 Tax=Thamnidium elegans TaxID=101142 RepID=A0A8H7VQ56_9FUNG|nr:hypothetical protein INT48_005617 [Thamnidium elegans]
MSPSKKTLIILASSTEPTQIEKDIKERYDSNFLRFRGVPKGLLPISGRPALSWWYEYTKSIFQNVYIVTNAYNFKHFERWSSGVNFPRENILNSGLGTGVLSDIAFVHRVKQIQTDIVITSAELFCDEDTLPVGFKDLFYKASNFIRYTKSCVPFAFGMSQKALQGLDDHNEKKLAMLPSRNPELFNRLDELDSYIHAQALNQVSDTDGLPLFDFVHPQLSLSSYIDCWVNRLDHKLVQRSKQLEIQTRPLHIKSYARVGLMGNPSDGFFGKTMSLLISNFWAEVTLIPNDPSALEEITILPNPVSDPHKFSCMASLVGVSEIDGYETGDRLLQACCKVFYRYCQQQKININTRQGFKMMFETNIPRQVGLAGSSAIITALWKMLTCFYGVTLQQIPLEIQASLVLKVEQEELGIAAGLQDRAFGGLVYMDFDKEYVEKNGHGKYEQLDVSLLPKLWLAYVADPDDSGKVHSKVKQRFLNGDEEIILAMKKFASFTEQARASLEKNDHKTFAHLMSSNFNLRRETYGDSVVGAPNLRMVELARQHHCAAKFPGSGGAVIGMWDGDDPSTEKTDLLKLRRALENEGFVFLEINPMVY